MAKLNNCEDADQIEAVLRPNWDSTKQCRATCGIDSLSTSVKVTLCWNIATYFDSGGKSLPSHTAFIEQINWFKAYLLKTYTLLGFTLKNPTPCQNLPMIVWIEYCFEIWLFHLKAYGQNSCDVRHPHDSYRYMSIGVVAIPVKVCNCIINVRKHIPMVEANLSKWSNEDKEYLQEPFHHTVWWDFIFWRLWSLL